MRQKRVLLAFVEAVHLVHKHQGAPPFQPVARSLRLLDRFADVLDATQHRADGDELRVKSVGHQPRNRGFSGARRPPQNAAMRLARLKSQAQRHTRAQDMRLPDHIAQGFGA